MNRIALLLELIGFCTASVSIAALQIDKIKAWADGVKYFLKRSFEKVSDSELRQSLRSESLVKHLGRVADCVILEPLRASRNVFRMLVAPLKINLPWKKRKRIVKLSFEILKNQLSVVGLGYRVFALVMTLALLRSFWGSMYFSLRILSRNQAITRLLIVVGTATLLAGLILELVANW